ncbi:hypothetical protein [Patulibacter sp.]|uniref:hypothetical protein n=1 Tax=Patulibacter sp. TaxID=1912859 RepID=UPI00271A336F|nr:hypothetical protein [Patulibacter sp.]MDO9409786.1 hypothetical protein [Patulibacter sp.]
MRVPAVVPGAAAACAVALAGCGADEDVRTVTVTAPNAASRPSSVPEPPTSTAASRPTATTTRTRSTVATTTAPPTRTVSVPTTVTTSAPRPTPRRPTPPAEEDADLVGGTMVASGRMTGTGYTVRVPTGWNDGARRYEGSGVAFDLTYVKGRGSGVASNILIVRTPDRLARRRDAVQLRDVLRRRLEAEAGGAEVDVGPRLTVDGEAAVSFAALRRIGPTTVLQRRVAVVRDGAVFTIALNAKRATADEDVRVFAAFLRSWRWR